MKNYFLNSIFFIALFLFGCKSGEEGKNQFVPIFTGKDLSGWEVKSVPSDSAKKYWYVKDGNIVANSMGDSLHDYIWLCSNEEYSDFHLKLKFQAFKNNKGNSGIQIRSRYDMDDHWLDGPQVDIHPSGSWRTGMMWDETRGNKRWIFPDLPDTTWVNPGMALNSAPFYYASDSVKWNELEIIAKGNEVKTWLNGILVTDFDGAGILNDKLHSGLKVGETGHICLQIHTRDQLKMKYKELVLKELNE